MISSQNKSRIKELIELTFYVIDKDSQDVQFKLNKAQERFLEDMTGRDLILKARQLGFSTLILAIFTYDFLFRENSTSMSISYETTAAQKLLEKVKHFIEPLGVPLRYDSRNELYNEQMKSRFYIGSAASVTTGRGQTINNLHVSELAFYDKADQLMTGLLQAVPKEGNVIIESTANGMGNFFHREWKKTDNDESAYTAHFFPWSSDPLYTAFVEPDFRPTNDERKAIEQFGLTRGQVMWMRNKKKEFKSDDAFKQEFPLSPNEAFISSGNPAFDMHSLQEMLERTKKPKIIGNLVGNKYHMSIEETDKGYLSVYEEPKDIDEYVVGADVAQTVDFSSAHVIKKRTAEVVAVWHGRIDPKDFGKELERLGYYYNTAMIGVERNNQGIATLVQLNDSYYPMLYYREDITDTGENSTSKLGWECVAPDTKILMSDFTWKEAKDVKKNDELISFEENSHQDKTSSRLHHRVFNYQNVVGVKKYQAESYKITFDDGRIITTSNNHPFLAWRSDVGQFWRNAEDLYVGLGIKAIPVVEPANTFSAGRLSGLICGEGNLGSTFDKDLGRYCGLRLHIGQTVGPLCDEILDLWKENGFNPSFKSVRHRELTRSHHKTMVYVGVNRGLRVFEVLQKIQPKRLIRKMKEKGFLSAMTTMRVPVIKITKIEKIGISEVVGIETSGHTLITNGILSHNTNIRTRPILISDLGMMIRNKDIHLWDEPTIDELMTFIRTNTGKEEAASGTHDDRVLSLAIAIQVYKRTPSSSSRNAYVTHNNPDLISKNEFDEASSAFDVY